MNIKEELRILLSTINFGDIVLNEDVNAEDEYALSFDSALDKAATLPESKVSTLVFKDIEEMDLYEVILAVQNNSLIQIQSSLFEIIMYALKQPELFDEEDRAMLTLLIRNSIKQMSISLIYSVLLTTKSVINTEGLIQFFAYSEMPEEVIESIDDGMLFLRSKIYYKFFLQGFQDFFVSRSDETENGLYALGGICQKLLPLFEEDIIYGWQMLLLLPAKLTVALENIWFDNGSLDLESLYSYKDIDFVECESSDISDIPNVEAIDLEGLRRVSKEADNSIIISKEYREFIDEFIVKTRGVPFGQLGIHSHIKAHSILGTAQTKEGYRPPYGYSSKYTEFIRGNLILPKQYTVEGDIPELIREIKEVLDAY